VRPEGPKSRESIERVQSFQKSGHQYVVYRYSAGRFECFLALYDGNVTVIAGRKYMAVRRLLQRH
jgi:hypothetical protein